MRVQQIDLCYANESSETLDSVILHVQSTNLSGQEVFREIALEAKEARALEQLLQQALRRLTREALKLI